MSVLDGKIAIVTGTSRGVGVGIAHELLRAGATVVGCSRSQLDAIPGIEPDWADRASQKVCDQGDYPLDRRVRRGRRRHPRSGRHSGEQCRRHRSGAACREHSRTGATHSGRPRRRRRLRAHGPVSRVRRADEPHQPALVRDPRLSADAVPGRRRLHHQHLQRCRVIRRDRRLWSPTGRPKAASTTSPGRWPKSGGPRCGSTASPWGRR